MNRSTVKGLIFAASVMLGSSALASSGLAVEEQFNLSCKACHEQQVAGAPGLTDKEAWAPRIESGVDAMTQTVLKGKGAMPPKGACFKCSDDEIKALVEHIISIVEAN